MQDSITPAFIVDLQNSSDSQDNNKKTFDRETQISEKSQTIQQNEQEHRQRQNVRVKQITKCVKQVFPERIHVSPKKEKQQHKQQDQQPIKNQQKNSIAYKQSDRKLLDSFEENQQRQQYIEDIDLREIQQSSKKSSYRKRNQPIRQYQQQEMIQKISNNSQEQYESSQDQQDQDEFQQSPEQMKQAQIKSQNQKIKTQPNARINIKKQPLFIEDHFDKVIRKVLPIGYKIVCTITIQSRFLGLSSKYNLNLKQNDVKNQYQFLLSAKKEMMKINSNFIISKNYDTRNIHKRDSNYVGLLDANFTGTQFTLHPPNNQITLLMINYGKNIMGHNGVREITVVKPKVGLPETSENTLNNLIMRKQDNKIQKLQAAKPVRTKSGWKVDFKGKAKQASAKNFILKDKKQRETLLFAKQSDDTFLMEVTHPFSILEAFAICLSSLDSKLFCN